MFFANAGIREKSFVLIHEKPVEDWDDVIDADLRAVFLQMRAVFPLMMERGGSFVTTSSVGGMWPLAQDKWVYTQTAYAVAKAGLIMLTKAAARQYGPYGIRVNAHLSRLSPDAADAGPMKWRKWKRTIARLLPLGRCGMPEEMKGLAVWLASDASSFVTGQVLVEDGGYSA